MVQEIRSDCSNGRRGISGSTLKLIAIVTMLIDHIGAVVVARMVLNNAVESGMQGMIADDGLYSFYEILRYIGRIAFPIFCFLMVEGFQRTHSKYKYALRLGVFALISEIPFDLALTSEMLEFSYQNVYFTLFIGLLTMIAVDVVDRMPGDIAKVETGGVWTGAKYLAEIVIVAMAAYVAELLHTDYAAKGVLCIMILYFFRKNKMLQIMAGCCAFLWETTAPLAFIPIWLYNGRRGLKLKYVFYLFYPIHLLILYLICVALGISGYSAV